MAADEILTLATLKTWTEIPDTEDDDWIALAITALNRAGCRLVGVALGPSDDSSRTYDGDAATDRRRRLWIPGGIREFTTVSVSTDGGTTWTAITTDIRLGPSAHSIPPGEPHGYIEFRDPSAIAGSYHRFPSGRDNVRITCTAGDGFGWAAWPSELTQDALSAFQRMSLDRDREGGSAFPSETSAERYLNAKLWRAYGARYFAPAA